MDREDRCRLAARRTFLQAGCLTALGLGLELVQAGRISLMRLVELFTSGPASVLGRKRQIAAGETADLTIFSVDQAWNFQARESASKSRNTPFDGRQLPGASPGAVRPAASFTCAMRRDCLQTARRQIVRPKE